MNNEFNNAMLDVRKAYRLLHDYQRMVLDGVKYIGNQLGLVYSLGVPKFSNSSRPRSGLDSWAWDWLNMVSYEFHFEGSDSIKFSIFLLSDTGYFESKSAKPEKIYTQTFLEADASHSKIILFASQNGWNFPPANLKNVQNLISDNIELPQTSIDAGMFACCYDIFRLHNMNSLNNMLEDFIAKAKKHDIQLKLTSLED